MKNTAFVLITTTGNQKTRKTMREKIADTYAKLVKREKEIRKEIAKKLFPGVEDLVGKKLYRLQSSPRHPNDELEEWTITGFSSVGKNRHELADYLGGYSLPGAKIITKVVLEEAKAYMEKYESAPLDMFEVIFYIERTHTWKDGSTSKAMSSERYTETGFPNNTSLDPESFKEKIAKDKEEYEKTYAPREGYIACERCGKQVPVNEVVKYKLIYQGYDQNLRKARVMSRIGTFCSGECAMNEQMSLEG